MSELLTSADLQQHIDEHNIQAQLITDIGDTPTVPTAAEALGVATEQIVKTLLFLVKQPGQANASLQLQPPQPVVVISHGERLIERKFLAERFAVGRKRIKLAPGDVVVDLLGYPPGGVPPFGHRTKLPVILDASILALAAEDAAQATTTVYGGGGDNQTMMAVTIGELLRVVEPAVLVVS